MQSLQQTLLSAQNVSKADAILGQVLDLFADAKGMSTKFEGRVKPGDQSLLVYDPQTELEPITASLHERMRELSLIHQSRTGLREKVKWALYEEKQFRRLIEDITDLVDKLVELFPAAEASQRRLCEVEVSEIGTESLPVLKETVVNQDRYLEAAVSKVLESRKGGSPSVVFSGHNNSGFQAAINHGTINSHWGQIDAVSPALARYESLCVVHWV